jgi:hypothetical protein
MDYINRHDEEIVFTLAQVFPVPARPEVELRFSSLLLLFKNLTGRSV